MSEREEFEKWYESRYFIGAHDFEIDEDCGAYADGDIQMAFEAWQAGMQ